MEENKIVFKLQRFIDPKLIIWNGENIKLVRPLITIKLWYI